MSPIYVSKVRNENCVAEKKHGEDNGRHPSKSKRICNMGIAQIKISAQYETVHTSLCGLLLHDGKLAILHE